MREEPARAEQQWREVERERDRVQRQNDRLKGQLDAAHRAGFRQAAPFAKAHPQGRGGRLRTARRGCVWPPQSPAAALPRR